MEFKRTKISRVFSIKEASEVIVVFSDGRMAMLDDKRLIRGIRYGKTEIFPEILTKTDCNGDTTSYLNRVYIEANGVIQMYFPLEGPQDITVKPEIEPDGSLSFNISKKYSAVVDDLNQKLGNWSSTFSEREQDTLWCKIKDHTGITVATSFETYCHIGMESTDVVKERLIISAAAVDLGIGSRVYTKFINIEDPHAVKVKQENGIVTCTSEYVVDKVLYDDDYKLFSMTISNKQSGQVVFNVAYLNLTFTE